MKRTNRKMIPLVIGFCIFCHSSAQASDLQFEVRAKPISNLIYQLDCMAETIRCSKKSYENLWQNQLKWSPTDQEFLKRWKELRLKYQGEIKLDDPPTKPFPLPWSGPIDIQISNKFSIATYHAIDRQDLQTRLEALVAPTDMETIDAVVANFEPRFNMWWQNSAQKDLTPFQSALDKKVHQADFQQKIEEFAKFYEAKYPPNYIIYLNLFYRPSAEGKGTFATVYDNHAAVEVLAGEKVANVLDVVTHEICHFFYSSSTDERKRVLLEAFANSKDPLAIATHNILNEALATAFGNGMAGELWMDSKHYQERFGKERGFYNDTAIDAAGKALLAMLKEDLKRGRTLYTPDFSERAIAAMKSGMPSLIRAPARLLTELSAIYDPKFKSVVEEKIRKKLRGGIYTREGADKEASWEMLKTYPKLTGILFLLPESLKALKAHTDLIPQADQGNMRTLFAKSDSFVYAVERGPGVYIFIVVGKTASDIEKQFTKLFEAKDRFVGPLPAG